MSEDGAVGHVPVPRVAPRPAGMTAWLERCREGLGVTGAVALVLDPAGRTLEIAAFSGYPEQSVDAWRRIRVDLPTPLTDAVRCGAAIVVPTPRDLGARYPALLQGRSDPPVLAALPVRSPEGVCVGVLGLTFADRDAVLRNLDALGTLGREAFEPLRRAGFVVPGPGPGQPGEYAPSSSSRIQALTAELSAALTPEAILDVVGDHARAVLGADLGDVTLLSPDGTELRLLRSSGTPPDYAARYGVVPVTAPTPVRDVIEGGLPVTIQRGIDDDRWPLMAGLTVEQSSFLLLPLPGEDQPLGVVTFGWLVRQEFTPELVRLALAVADVCAAAFRRAGRYSEQASARAQAEALTRRLRALQTITSRLAGAVEPEALADAVVSQAADVIGAQAVVVSEYDGAGRITTLATRGMSGDRWEVTDVADSVLAVELLRTRSPVVVQTLAERDTRFPDMARNGVLQQAWANLPLLVSGRVVGLVGFGWDAAHAVDAAELEFLTAVADHLALAIERVRLLRGAQMSAETLQRALLPQVLRTADGWDLATAYTPAVEGTQVGGDWYDTFGLPDGSVGLVLGDVMGNGLAAASTMGSVRSALRAFATLDADPATVLSAVDTYLETFAPDAFVTCFYAVLDPRTGRLRHASAGHPPAVLAGPAPLGRDGRHGRAGAQVRVRWLEAASSTPLGVPPPDGRDTAVTTVEPGELVVLYSDGLVEDRARSLSEGLAELADAVADVAPEDDLSLAVHLLVDAMAAQRRNRDDVAVLAMRRRVTG